MISCGTVGFHNFNLRIFDLSLKSEQISCGCFFYTMSDFNVLGSRPKNARRFGNRPYKDAAGRLAGPGAADHLRLLGRSASHVLFTIYYYC